MNDETLTEDERERLDEVVTAGALFDDEERILAKALRIMDAALARAEAAELKKASLMTELDCCLSREHGEHLRAERAESEASQAWVAYDNMMTARNTALAESAELRARLEAAEKSEREWKYWRATAVKASDRAESEAAALRAEVERCRAESATAERTLRGDYQRAAEGLVACRTRLAAAEGLLDEANGYPLGSLGDRIEDFLSAQPAASAKAAEERAVLDAVRYTDWSAVQRHCRDACWLPPDLIALSDAALRWLAAPDATAG